MNKRVIIDVWSFLCNVFLWNVNNIKEILSETSNVQDPHRNRVVVVKKENAIYLSNYYAISYSEALKLLAFFNDDKERAERNVNLSQMLAMNPLMFALRISVHLGQI
jgi:hypothetical protein